MDGMRKAALAISALHQDDRAWILAQLPGAARRELRKLMREAATLDLLPDTQTLRELSEPVDGAAATAHPLAVASAGDVSALLAAEPDWLIAAVLRAGSWSWHAEFLAMLGEERRRDIAHRTEELRPRALQALCATLEARMAAVRRAI